MLTRRNVLRTSVVGVSSMLLQSSYAQSGPRLPDSASLQSGDFLWPKKPGAYIPYFNEAPDVDADKEAWVKEKEEVLKRARSSENPDLRAAADRIAPLAFGDFRALYFRDPGQEPLTPYSLGGIAAVGHVGIVEVDSTGRPWIIEALWTPGVTRSTYTAWLGGRPGEIVWHGRLKGATQSDRGKIAREAARWVSKPYDFWNFNLADTNGFYCSKLAWLCVMDALAIPLDGNPNPRRNFWLSPKQVLYSDKIDILLNPGEYAVE